MNSDLKISIVLIFMCMCTNCYEFFCCCCFFLSIAVLKLSVASLFALTAMLSTDAPSDSKSDKKLNISPHDDPSIFFPHSSSSLLFTFVLYCVNVIDHSLSPNLLCKFSTSRCSACLGSIKFVSECS